MPAASLDAFDRKLVTWSAAAIGVAVLASTWLHFFAPQVLQVPQVVLPDDGPADRILFEVMTLVMTALCAWHCVRALGAYATTLFLAGSFVFTGMLENLMILGGRFSWLPFPTYYFGKGGYLYFGEVPVTTCLGWFVLAYGTFVVARAVLPRSGEAVAAAIAAFICMDLDLWYDPVMTHPANAAWTWLQAPDSTTRLLSIPLYNFAGWFGIIFLFELLWAWAWKRCAALGKPRATGWFLAGVAGTIVGYLLIVVAVELAVRAWLPKVNWTIGGV